MKHLFNLNKSYYEKTIGLCRIICGGAFVSCPDWVSARGMRMLGVPVKGDPVVISGESGAVGMGLLAALMETDVYRDLREALELDRFSQVLMFSTEGNTDPMKFRKVLWDGEYPTV